MRYLIPVLIALLLPFTHPVHAQDDCTFTQLNTAIDPLSDIITRATDIGTDMQTSDGQPDAILSLFGDASALQYEWFIEIKPDLPRCNEINSMVLPIDNVIVGLTQGLFSLYAEQTGAFEDYITLGIDGFTEFGEVAESITAQIEGR